MTASRKSVAAFAAAARRACQAGFRVIEIHAAHGYLIHEFLSPLSNHRDDDYGGSFENRTRLCREIVAAVRSDGRRNCRYSRAFLRRIGSTAGGTLMSRSNSRAELKPLGVDLIDCSSGGNVPHAKIPVGPGYQIAFAERIRRESRNYDRGGWNDYVADSSGAHHSHGEGGCDDYGARISARPILAVASSSRTWAVHLLASAIS